MLLVLALSAVAAAGEIRTVDLKLPAHFDPFASKATAQYGRSAAIACGLPKPSNFIGYRWRLPAIAAELRAMPGESAGKQTYIGFLKSKYGYQIARFNQDYGTDAQSFTELLESQMKAGPLEHDREFEAPVRQEMMNAILSALRKCDPDHADGFIRSMLNSIGY